MELYLVADTLILANIHTVHHIVLSIMMREMALRTTNGLTGAFTGVLHATRSAIAATCVCAYSTCMQVHRHYHHQQ